MKRETVQRVASPTAILVALPDEMAATCTEALEAGGVRKVLRAGHVAAACERIPIVMPQLVVVPSTIRPDDMEMLDDRCVAVGATVLKVTVGGPEAELLSILKDAATDALIKAIRHR